FTDFWNRPGASDVLTSAIMPTLIVVAVSPTSVPGAAEPAGAAGVPPPAAVAELEAVVAPAGPVDELLELQPAASRTAASAAITPSRRARAGNGCLARSPALSLLAVTLVSFDVIAGGIARERGRVAARPANHIGRVIRTGHYKILAGHSPVASAAHGAVLL